MVAAAAPATSSAIEIEMARLRAENDKLRKRGAHAPSLSFKVSPKGGLSVYGLQRWPTTLYKEQWARLLASETVKQITDFIAANDRRLKSKDEAGDDDGK